jgi:hypothetical protein
MEDPQWKPTFMDWCRADNTSEKKLERLCDLMRPDFPDLQTFEASYPMIQKLMRLALPLDQQHILNETDNFVGTRGQTEKQKEMMKTRKTIQNKFYDWTKKIKEKLFPEATDLKKINRGLKEIEGAVMGNRRKKSLGLKLTPRELYFDGLYVQVNKAFDEFAREKNLVGRRLDYTKIKLCDPIFYLDGVVNDDPDDVDAAFEEASEQFRVLTLSPLGDLNETKMTDPEDNEDDEEEKEDEEVA